MDIFEAFRARRPDCAVLIGLLFGPDVVMAYLGCGLLAIAYFVGGVSVSAGLIWLFIRLSIPAAYGALVVLVWHSFGAVLGYCAARSLPENTTFPWYSRWYSIVLLFSAAIIAVAMIARSLVFQAPGQFVAIAFNHTVTATAPPSAWPIARSPR